MAATVAMSSPESVTVQPARAPKAISEVASRNVKEASSTAWRWRYISQIMGSLSGGGSKAGGGTEGFWASWWGPSPLFLRLLEGWLGLGRGVAQDPACILLLTQILHDLLYQIS